MKKILFSIIVPCYKSIFLRECIDSVLAQSFANFELILVNDASPHNLDNIVCSYDDPRIRYYKRKENMGSMRLAENWNDCLKYAKGDYVICMGDDDRMLPSCLQDYVSLIAKYPNLNVYHMRSSFIDEKGRVTDIQLGVPEWMSVYELMWMITVNHYFTMIGDCCYNTSALRQEGGWYVLPYAWHSDRISLLRAAKKSGVASTTKVGFEFRRSSFQISNALDVTDDKILIWKDIKKWYENFLSKEPEDKEDRIFYNKIRLNLNKFIDDNQQSDIDNNLRQHPWLIWRYVIFCRRKLGISSQLSRRLIMLFFYRLFVH